MVKDFIVTCPLIIALRSPTMRERHWNEVMKVLKTEFILPSENPDMILNDLISFDLHKYISNIEEISDKAAKEAKHEETLQQLESSWSEVNFTMTPYKETDIPLIKLNEDVVEQLESDQMAVQSIVGSRYSHFKTQAQGWQKTLNAVSDITQLLIGIQRTWTYLEPLFIGSEEVKKELATDAKKFEEVDQEVKALLYRAWKLKNVKLLCEEAGLLEKLQLMEKKQDSCKKKLSEFIDGKRRQFPRFFFMSESDLLDMLSNSSRPDKVLSQVSILIL